MQGAFIKFHNAHQKSKRIPVLNLPTDGLPKQGSQLSDLHLCVTDVCDQRAWISFWEDKPSAEWKCFACSCALNSDHAPGGLNQVCFLIFLSTKCIFCRSPKTNTDRLNDTLVFDTWLISLWPASEVQASMTFPSGTDFATYAKHFE